MKRPMKVVICVDPFHVEHVSGDIEAATQPERSSLLDSWVERRNITMQMYPKFIDRLHEWKYFQMIHLVLMQPYK